MEDPMGLETPRRSIAWEHESSASERCSLCARVVWASDELMRTPGGTVHRWCFERDLTPHLPSEPGSEDDEE
jgi:hypothetical protein